VTDDAPAVTDVWRWIARGEPPGRDALQRMSDAHGGGWRLVDPRQVTDGYESAVARGEIPTRDRSWHDAFNIAAFLAWPQAKRALHGFVLAEQRRRAPQRRRSRAEDALALLDEAVVIVAGEAESLARFDAARRAWPATPAAAMTAMDEAVRHGLVVRWFGHALLEHLALARPAIDAGVWTLALPATSTASVIDAALARDIEAATFARPCFSPTIPWPDPTVLRWLDAPTS
jgi:hypothetical protein